VNNLFTKIRDKHALWYKGIVFALSVILCTYLLPKTNTLKTTKFTKGDVWLNDDLLSDFDFLVKKTAADFENDHNSLNSKISYFIKQQSVLDSILQKIEVDDKPDIIEHLKRIYQTGLCAEEALKQQKDSLIYIVENNEVTLVNKNNLYTKSKLRNLLKDQLNENESRILVSNLKPNIIYDEALSNEIGNEEYQEKNIFKDKIKKGDILLSKNDVLTADKINILQSYNYELEEKSKSTSIFFRILGQLLTSILVLGIMMLFLAFFRKSIFSQNSQVTFIFLIILLIVFTTSIVASYNNAFIYAVPFCLVPILVRVFFDSRTSLFNFLNVILLCALFTQDKFEFIFIQLIAGIGTIFSVADMGKRSKLFISALLIFVFYFFAFVAYQLINDTWQAINDFKNYIPFLISSVCVLFSFPLIYFFEKLFGFTSAFTLLELCDLNAPLLRELSQKIPGTFQHSLQVANLAEEACYTIGGNALLVRTGAMYHDIGKMHNPRFFTENQVGEVSPHQELSSEDSAKIIIDHVIKGVEIAKKYEVPEAIIDFIRTHHGTTTTRYFLYNYKKEHEGEVINEDLFRYKGPIPFSKETAILMMADGVEASSRSLKKYDAVTIDELVDRIIDHQIKENQFINADITFRDINQIKKIFKKRLMNIYHVRIEYPR
jgi:cyclic-di-AMP phosphodiesterase PgpH